MKAVVKTKIKKTVEEEFEIKLPCYVRTQFRFFKIYSDKKAIEVFSSDMPAISVVGINTPFNMDWSFCNAEDFASAFENAMELIENGAYAKAGMEVEDDAN